MPSLSDYRVRPLTENHCREICLWKYNPPYDIYNWDAWDRMVAEQYEFADEVIRREQYASVQDKEGRLCGFAQFFPLEGIIRLGLGMHPEWVGKGLGVMFTQALVKEAQVREPGREIDLEVLVWNRRAQKVYERAGFVITDQYKRATPTGQEEFYCMVYQPGK